MESPAVVHQVKRRCPGMDEFGEGSSNANTGSVTLPTQQSQRGLEVPVTLETEMDV